jgi:hypothetical protein
MNLIIISLYFSMNVSSSTGDVEQDVNFQIQTISKPDRALSNEPLGLLVEDKYHNLSEVYHELDNFNTNASHLIDYANIGYSYMNNSIPLITLTNEQIPDEAKGKTYIVAHHHAREQITIEHTLRTIRDLVNNYNNGDRSTVSLLDKFIIYFIVTLNPDSLDHVLYENEHLRKTMRPIDEDGDGKFDEDGPEDTNGDGRISEYHVYLTNQSEWVYQYYYMEGIDNDNDGLLNEDRIGGVDLNRNYPFHWNDSSTDSGWGNDKSSYTYPGPEPASENETRALMDFVSKHNFTHALSLHSGTNASLFDWSYTNEIQQPEASIYESLLNDFKMMNLLHYSFFLEENEVDYTCAGEWGDWTYATQHTIPLTMEIYHLNRSEYFSDWTFEGDYATGEFNTMFEYFNPYEDRIEALHQELFGFEEYWLSLTPWIQLLSIENTTGADSTRLTLKVKSGSWYFNTTDRTQISIIPSENGFISDFPSSIEPLQPRETTTITIVLKKDLPEDFYLDINISSQWAADLQLHLEVASIEFKSTNGFDNFVTLFSLIVAIPLVRRVKQRIHRDK